MRRRSLPRGWYPEEAAAVRDWIRGWETESRAGKSNCAIAGIVPHAGWYYSGLLSYEVVRCLSPDIDTVVIVGGHLSESSHCMAAEEDEYETPLGSITADRELGGFLAKEIDLLPDRYTDNTVEIHLPIVRALMPNAMVVGLRAPPSSEAIRLGRAVYDASVQLGRKVAVVGSTDLTHYGPNYRYSPAGSGDAAQRWVREKNDAGMIDRFLKMQTDGAIEYALTQRAACSVGGAVAAIAYASSSGIRTGSLLDYRTSLELGPSSSFVGYSAITFSLPDGARAEESVRPSSP